MRERRMGDRRRDRKDEVCLAYSEKQISRKLAAARLSELKYEEWEINLFLDDDQTGPDDDDGVEVQRMR